MDTNQYPSEGIPPLLASLILTAVTLGVYFVTLFNGFVWDDGYIIVENPATRSFTNLRDILLSPDIVKPYYRPLNRASYLLDFQLFGMNPAGFHAVNTVIHTLNVLLVYLLGRRLFTAGPAPLAAALLFAVHPINVETVTFISARNNLSALFFSLACFLAFLRGRDSGGLRWHAFGALFLFLGLMSKETALMVIVPVCLYTFQPFHGTGGRKDALFRWGLVLLPYLAVIAVYLLMRSAALEGVLGTGMATAELPQRLARNLYIIPRYLALFLFPAGLTIFHAVPPDWASAPWLIPAWVAIIAALGLILVRGGPAARFGLLWLGVNFLPVSNIVPIPSYPMAERFMYLPSAGFCLIAGALLGGPLFERLGTRVAWGVVGIAAALLALVTVERNLDWRDDVSLFSSVVERDPRSAEGYFNLGSALIERGNAADARAAWERALRVEPDHSGALAQLGTLAARQGDLARARTYYLAAVRSNPANAMARYNLARIYDMQGEPSKALEQYELFLRHAPVEYGEYVPEVRARIGQLRPAPPTGGNPGKTGPNAGP